MVRQVRITLLFLQLIRFPNLIIIAMTQYFIRWYIMKPLLSVSGFKIQLGTGQFAMLVLSTVSIAAAGYIINDYFDRKTDLINRPGRVIVGRIINRRYAIIFHVVFTGIGLLAGAYVAYSIGHISLTLLFLFASGVLWLYSTTYKRQILVGNIVISILVALVPLMVLLFEFPLLVKKYQFYALAAGMNFDNLIVWVCAYSGFAFLVNLTREIIKDMEDFEGDSVFGRQTVPIVWGIKASRILVALLTAVTIVPIFYLLMFHLTDRISFTYIVLFIVLPLFLISTGIFWADSKQRYHTLSQIIKIVMFTGLMYCPVANFIISHF